MSIKTILNLVILLSGSLILYKDKPVIKISYSLLLLFVFAIVDVIFGNIFALVLGGDYSIVFYSSFSYRFTSCMAIKAIDIMVLFVMQRLFKRIDKNSKEKYWGLLGAVFLVLLLTTVIFLHFYIKLHQTREIIMLFLFISLAFFSMSLIVVYSFSEICEGTQREKRLYALEADNKVLDETLAVQSSNSENLQKLRHDITKHTANAAALIERGMTNDAIKLLNDTSNAAKQLFPRYNVSTGSHIADAVISSKAALCESKGIKFTYCIEPLNEIKIESVDLSSLLSNLLDNAIEAAQQTQNCYIKLDIFKYKAYYGICVENSFPGKNSIVHNGSQLLSTKSNSAIHGYGMQIIEDIAKKYNGDSTWNADGECFKSNVLLKI